MTPIEGEARGDERMEPRSGGPGGHDRHNSRAFSEVALAAYIRHLALEKWREVTALQATPGIDLKQAVQDAGCFVARGAYRDIWERCWQSGVVAYLAAPEMPLYRYIEAAMQRAVQEEMDARKRRGDVAFEETIPHLDFLEQALNQLLKKAGEPPEPA